MAISAATLRTLHRLHIQLTELRDRLARGPKLIAIREQNVAARQADLAKARETEKQAKMLADRKQLDLKSSEQRLVDWRLKLNTCSSNKEFQTLKDQIAAAEMANSVLADEILETLERIDQLGEKVRQAEAALQATESELAKVRDAIAATADSIRGDIERLASELAEAERALPATFLGDYHRVVKMKGADGLAEAEDGVCTGCGQQITANMQNELLLSKPVFCHACGRLLYLPE